MASLQAPQTATVDKFIAGWKKPFAEEMLAILSDDVTQQALRLSLGRPSRARAQVEATLPKLGQILTNYSVSLSIALVPIRLTGLITCKAYYPQLGARR